MKALFVHDHKFPERNNIYYTSYGFDEEFFKRYLEIFKDIDFIGRSYGPSDKEINVLNPINKNVKFYTLSSYRGLLSRRIRMEFKKYIFESDYLVIRLPSILGLYALNLAKKLNKKCIIEVVGSAWDSLWYQSFSKKLFAPVFSLLCKRAIKNASHVVYVTENYLQKNYPTNGKSIHCSNVTLIDVEERVLRNRVDKIKSNKKNGKIIIGTCATLNIYKGQQNVIKAMSHLISSGYDIEYQLVGGGDPTYLNSVANEYKVTEYVRHIGKLKHDEVFKWMDQIDIYIQPSLTEGLPRAVIEAMSRGCPTIGSNAGGITELVNERYVYNKNDINKLVTLLKKLNNESMLLEAEQNHKKSKQYLKEILDDRRQKFFCEYINYVNEKK